jgi:DNA-binding MarR family transcriptional regulator
MQEAHAIMSEAPTVPARADLARRLVEDFLAPSAETRPDRLSLTTRHHEILRALKAGKAGLLGRDLTEHTSSRDHPHGEAVVAALAQRLIDEGLVAVVREAAGRRYSLTDKGLGHIASHRKGTVAPQPARQGRRKRITDVLGLDADALKARIAEKLAESHPELLGPAEVAEKMGLERAAGTGTIRALLSQLVAAGEAEWIELRPGCGVYRASSALAAAKGAGAGGTVSPVAGRVLAILAGSTRPVEVAVIAREIGLPKAALRLATFELKQGGYVVRKRRRGVVSYLATDLGRTLAAGG